MIRNRRLMTLFTLALLLTSLSLITNASAKKAARGPVDPDAPTEEQAKVLGWGPVKTPNRGVRPEYLIRGVILDVQKAPEGKDLYTVSILPIEVLNNLQRDITFDHFQTGVNITIPIQKPRLKELKPGRMVEFNQYYTEEVEQSIGGAKMVAMSMHQEIQGYPAGPGAYLKKGGFYPIQYKNAIKGMKMYLESIESDKEVQNFMDYLATKSDDAELKTIAKATYLEVYNMEPTGKCDVDKTTQACTCH